MIDVPIAVRDALKDGGYKKNYRFVIGDAIMATVYRDVETLQPNTSYTITMSGEMRLYNSLVNVRDFEIEIEYGESVVIDPVERMLPDPTGGYYYPFNITPEMVGGSIIISTLSGDGEPLILQSKTAEKSEVFVPRFTIENDRLVKESVKIDERLCSDEMLKFGLCEGSSLEFQAFDIENLTNKRVQAFVDVEYPVVSYEEDEEAGTSTKIITMGTCTIPMGFYDVHESSRQASTGIRKITAFNKLKSDYLDKDMSAEIKRIYGSAIIHVRDILKLMLKTFSIIDVSEYEYVPPVPSQTWDWEIQQFIDSTRDVSAVWSNAKRSFTPIKIESWSDPAAHDMDFGPFAPAILHRYYGANNGAKVYLEGFALRYMYYDRTTTNPLYEIELHEYVEYLDNAIKDFINTELYKACGRLGAGYDTGTEEVVRRLWQMESDPYSQNGSLRDYFFYVEVRFKDGSYQIFGDQLRNATGSFDDLRSRTFSNVADIRVIYPYYIKFGTKFTASSGYWAGYIDDSKIPKYFPDGTPTRATNSVAMIGEPHEYMYWDPFGEGDDPIDPHYAYKYYTPPTLPDGSIITDEILRQLIKVKTISVSGTGIEMAEINPQEISSVSLRDLQTAVFEINCQFGKLDRNSNYFSGIELNNGRLYPADTLYPDDALYPMSQSESGFRAMYSKLWADEGNVHSWRNLIITYKGLIENEDTHEHEESEKIYTIEIDANGTDDYEVTANWLFKNLLWADSESESWQEAAGLENIEDYADAMVAKMQSVSWFPFEMWCAGLPYVETGDEVEIVVGEHAYTSYVLRRTIKGIQNLQDEMINGTLDIF